MIVSQVEIYGIEPQGYFRDYEGETDWRTSWKKVNFMVMQELICPGH